MKTVIILSGKKSTGKDTSCNYIRKFLGHNNTQAISYADPIKRFCMDVFGLSRLQCYGESKERNSETSLKWSSLSSDYRNWGKSGNLSARDVLQIVGTNVLRGFCSSIWSNAAKVAAQKSNKDVVIFTDARFPDEIMVFQYMKSIRLITIRLSRDTGILDSHLSETALDLWDNLGKFDYFVENNGTLEDLEEAMHLIIKENFDGIY